MTAFVTIGCTAQRFQKRIFGLDEFDRAFHLHLIGKTGTGKTSVLERLLEQDVEGGRGCALIDPHGDLALRVRAHARSRRSDLVYLDAADPDAPVGYNPVRAVAKKHIPLAVSGLMEVFKKRFADAWGVRMEHVLRYRLVCHLGSWWRDNA